jgi:hypothetical protein
MRNFVSNADNPGATKENSTMKKYFLIAAVMMLPWLGAAVSVPTVLFNSGPLSVKWVVSTQGLVNSTALAKTNTTATTTNSTVVYKSTVTNSIFSTPDLLALLENSLNTTFPAGSQLVLSRVGDFISLDLVDASGTNIVQSLSTNLIMGTIFGEQPVRSILETVTTQTGPSGSSASNIESETLTDNEVITYDDTGLTTRDGTHSQFQITFLLVDKSSQSNGKLKDAVKLQGVGYGTIRGQNVMIQGTGGATITGKIILPV